MWCRIQLVVILALLWACGEPEAPPSEPRPPSAETKTKAPAPPLPRAPVVEEAPLELGACGFADVESLCAGLREHLASTHESHWVSRDCAIGRRVRSEGPFAEALVVAASLGGNEGLTDAIPWTGRSVLEGTLTEPANQTPRSTKHVLAVRTGRLWTPVHIATAELLSMEGELDTLEFSLRDDGAQLTIDAARGNETEGSGERRRRLLGVVDGRPKILFETELASWTRETDPRCVCGGLCPECWNHVRTERSWDVLDAERVRIGASVRTRIVRGVPSRVPPRGSGDTQPSIVTVDACRADGSCLDACAFTRSEGDPPERPRRGI